MSFTTLAEIATYPMPGDRRRSSIERTGEPVRRQSFRADRPAPGYRCKLSRKEARDLVLAAKLYDNAARKDGKRPLGRAALDILELLANLAAYSGRVEPPYTYIMKQCGVARDTITRALKALRAHGFLDWMRRYVPTGNAEGPQVVQTTNAYRLSVPALAKRLLEAFFKPRTQIPDDLAHEAQERARQIEAMRATLTLREQLHLDLNTNGDDPDAPSRFKLAESLARMGEGMQQKRESEKRGESGDRFKI